MVSAKNLLSLIESTLLGPTSPTPSQRIELLHAIRHSLPSLQNLLSYPPPKPSDRVQVQSKEVRLPDSGPISLDDQDVQIALKLSNDLHLNEIDSVRLLVSANQEVCHSLYLFVLLYFEIFLVIILLIAMSNVQFIGF